MGYLDSISGMFGQTGNVRKAAPAKNVGEIQQTQKTAETASTTSVETTATDFTKDLEALQGKVKMNSPESQGLSSAADVRKGQLSDGYYFEGLDNIDTALFDLKYNTANAPRIAAGTNSACDGVEYAQVAGHLQTDNNPYQELFV